MGSILAQQRCAAHRQPPCLARHAPGKLHAMEIKELGHLVLYVHDIERSAALYRDVVGMSDHTVTHSLYITDPDGNEIELYIDVPGVSWDLEHVMAPVKALAL